MLGKPAKSSSFFIRRGSIRPHRHPKMGAAVFIEYLKHTVGDFLYYVGAQTERGFKSFGRFMRHGAKAVSKAVGSGIGKAVSFIADKLVEIGGDIAAPFIKLVRSVRSLVIVIKSSWARGFMYTAERVRMFFKYGWRWNKPMISRAANRFLPIISAVACIFVIGSLLSLNYVLKVDYNGQTVGYVRDETAYDDAVRIIQNRMVSSQNYSWSDSSTLSIAVVEDGEISTQDELAEALLSVSGEEIAQATGIYIGGTLYGATTAGDLLSDALDGILEPYREAAAEIAGDVTVKFARDVELVSGVYPADSILAYDDLLAKITSTQEQDIYYVAKEGDLASEVASKNGISTDTLAELNGGDISETLSEGTTLLVATGEPLLRVKTISQVVRTESVAYTQTVVKDSRFDVGYLWTKTEGELGERTITYEIEYVDGKEVSTTIISNVITKEPVNKEIIIGSKRGENSGDISVGTGEFTWPTGTPYGISRGFRARTESDSGHLGIDIWASTGTPIYAADNGVVITSGWTDTGYGYYIIIDHQNGIVTVYGHCSELYASVGDTVQKGEVIAAVGSTGNSSGPHLHFEVRVQGEKVDPAYYLYD